jgi:hypothetical protein
MYLTKLLLFAFLFIFLQPSGQANVVYNHPPVEKIKQQQKKTKKGHTRKFRKRYRIGKEKQQNEIGLQAVLLIFMAIGLVIALTIGILFGFGVISALLALIFIGLGNLLAYTTGTILIHDMIDEAYGLSVLYLLIFAPLYIVNAVFGIYFIVIGLSLVNPFLLALGILLLGILLVAFLIHALVLWGNMWMD